MEELYKEYLKQRKESHIYIDGDKVDIKGCAAALLTYYTQITEAMAEFECISKEDLQEAFDFAFMSSAELEKVALEKLKNKLEDITNKLKKGTDSNE